LKKKVFLGAEEKGQRGEKKKDEAAQDLESIPSRKTALKQEVGGGGKVSCHKGHAANV